jgi:hypothetical protein
LKKDYHIIFIIVLLLILPRQNTSAQDTLSVAPAGKKSIKIIPMRATMLSAVFPGFGQIYNRKYWKIPLVYAGFGGMGYAVIFNTKYYNRFTKAYQDFTDLIPVTDSYVSLIRGADPKSYDPVLHPDTYSPSTASWVKDQLLLKVDYYKKYRDLSYIGIAFWYIISILDANVDASLFDYDIGENLNLTLAPVQIPLYNFTGVGINLSMKINF